MPRRSPAPRWPAPPRSSPSTSTTGSSTGAKELGATHTVEQREPPTRSRRSRRLTGGFGADVVIDAVGRPETWKQAFYARDLAGTVVLVGVPTPDMKVSTSRCIDVFGRGGALKSSWYGDCLPSRDFPMLVDLYLQGRLDLDALRHREDRARRRRGGVREDAPRRRAALGRPPVSAEPPGRPRRHHAARSASTAAPGTSTTTSGSSATTTSASSSTRRTTPRRSLERRRRPAGDWRSSAPTPTTTTCGSRRRCAERGGRADPAAPGRPAAVGADPPRPRSGRRPGRRADASPVGGAATSRCCTPPATRPGSVCLYAADLGVRLHRRHAVPRRPGRDRPVATATSRRIIESIRARLLALPDDTVVHTGHGDDTTIGAERTSLG